MMDEHCLIFTGQGLYRVLQPDTYFSSLNTEIRNQVIAKAAQLLLAIQILENITDISNFSWDVYGTKAGLERTLMALGLSQDTIQAAIDNADLEGRRSDGGIRICMLVMSLPI